jgi:DNA-binding HxlR family transcriptional regulator
MSNPAPAPPRVVAAPVPQDQCGLAHAADLLGDRWVLLILREAFYGVTRFDDLQRDLQAPRAMLSQRLGRLVEHGLMQRAPYQDPGGRTRHEYRLTAKGRGLGLSLMALMAYGDAHLRDASARVSVVDALDGAPLAVSFVRPDGAAVTPERARLQVRD